MTRRGRHLDHSDQSGIHAVQQAAVQQVEASQQDLYASAGRSGYAHHNVTTCTSAMAAQQACSAWVYLNIQHVMSTTVIMHSMGNVRAPCVATAML